MRTYSESETLEKLAGYSISDVATEVTGWSGSMRNALAERRGICGWRREASRYMALAPCGARQLAQLASRP